jgi:hypothetical protein
MRNAPTPAGLPAAGSGTSTLNPKCRSVRDRHLPAATPFCDTARDVHGDAGVPGTQGDRDVRREMDAAEDGGTRAARVPGRVEVERP